MVVAVSLRPLRAVSEAGVVVLLAAACSGTSTSPPASPDATADRSPEVTAAGVSPATSCRGAARRPASPAFGRRVLGPGPVYAVTASDTYRVPFPPLAEGIDGPAGGPWYGQKVGWLVAPEATGGRFRVTVSAVDRGGRAVLSRDDRAGGFTWVRRTPVRPGPGAGAGPGGPRMMPSLTLVTRSGCYAWHVDGNGVSQTIVFAAEVARR